MNNRIHAIIKHSGLSASDFANAIGVTKASISHILTGRNNPSLDFVQRVLSRFQDINADWLISGKGTMIKSQSGKLALEPELKPTPVTSGKNVPHLFSYAEPAAENSIEPQTAFFERNEQINTETQKTEPVARSFTQLAHGSVDAGRKNIRRVILLNEDNTFSVYEADGV